MFTYISPSPKTGHRNNTKEPPKVSSTWDSKSILNYKLSLVLLLVLIVGLGGLNFLLLMLIAGLKPLKQLYKKYHKWLKLHNYHYGAHIGCCRSMYPPWTLVFISSFTIGPKPIYCTLLCVILKFSLIAWWERANLNSSILGYVEPTIIYIRGMICLKELLL
jgi:hypothetical protein